MPGLYFADTSALLPRFLRNVPGHAWMRDLSAPTSNNLIAIAEITEAEIASAINQLAPWHIYTKEDTRSGACHLLGCHRRR
jgi:hypothetical protein